MSVYDLPPMSSAEVWVGVVFAVIVGWLCLRATHKAERRYTARILHSQPVTKKTPASTTRPTETRPTEKAEV